MMTKRGIKWLSAAAEDAEGCRAVWEADPRRPQMMSTGRYFDVVVIAQRLGLETFDQLDRHHMPLGPVMADWSSRHVGFFLPSGSQQTFTGMVERETEHAVAYRYLDPESVVVVPGPMPLSDDRYVWLRAPMRRPEATTARTAALAAMLVAASSVIDRADRYGREHMTPAGAFVLKREGTGRAREPDGASWSPIDSEGWYAARDAVSDLRDVLIAAGLEREFPYLRADLNAFGHGLVELGRVSPEAAERLAELLRLATECPHGVHSGDRSPTDN